MFDVTNLVVDIVQPGLNQMIGRYFKAKGRDLDINNTNFPTALTAFFFCFACYNHFDKDPIKVMENIDSNPDELYNILFGSYMAAKTILLAIGNNESIYMGNFSFNNKEIQSIKWKNTARMVVAKGGNGMVNISQN
jgi:hypothetical protein